MRNEKQQKQKKCRVFFGQCEMEWKKARSKGIFHEKKYD